MTPISIEAVFTILNKNMPANDYQISEDDLRIIEECRSEYKSGKAKTYTVNEVTKKILKNLGK